MNWRGRKTFPPPSPYESAMRMMVMHGQKVSGIGPRMLIPSSKLSIALLYGFLRVVTRPAVMKALDKAFGGKPVEPDLERYALRASAIE